MCTINKSAHTKKVVGTVHQVHCSRRRLLRRGLEFHVCTINKSAHTKKVVGTVHQVHCSRRRLLRRGLEFHVCTINKSAHKKKSLETYLMILVFHCHYSHVRVSSPGQIEAFNPLHKQMINVI